MAETTTLADWFAIGAERGQTVFEKWDSLTLTEAEWIESDKIVLAEGYTDDEDDEGVEEVRWTQTDALAMRLALIDTPEARELTEKLDYCNWVEPTPDLTYFPSSLAVEAAEKAIDYCERRDGVQADCGNVWTAMEQFMREASRCWVDGAGGVYDDANFDDEGEL